MSTPISSLEVRFVEFVPESITDGVIYVSLDYATASHLCCCGCRSLVVTPLSPDDWKITYDGRSISLYPSIGNWGFECRSHYWIRNSKIEWAEDWSTKDIEKNRGKDRRRKKRQHKMTGFFFSKWKR